MADGRKYALHNAQERFTPTEFNRISTLLLRFVLDGILFRAFEKSGGGVLAPNDLAFFGDDFEVTYQSGNREAGLVFAINQGLGLKFEDDAGQPDANRPTVIPVMLAANFVLPALAVSDPTNDRIDEVYVKPLTVQGDGASRDIIDPTTLAITTQVVNTTESYQRDIAVAEGTPAGSPVAAAVPAGYDATDRIATITVRAGSGAFSGADLTDQRTTLVART